MLALLFQKWELRPEKLGKFPKITEPVSVGLESELKHCGSRVCALGVVVRAWEGKKSQGDLRGLGVGAALNKQCG